MKLIFVIAFFFAFQSQARFLTEPELSLLSMAEKGDLQGVTDALNQKASINASDFYDHTALMKASAKGHIEIVKLLIEKKAQLNLKGLELGAESTSHKSDSALMMAIENEKYDVVEALILAGANVNQKDIMQRTALVKLIDNSTNLKLKKKISKAKLLELSKLMIAHGADLNLGRKEVSNTNKKGKVTTTIESEVETPLMFAAEGGQAELVEYFLSQGADPAINVLDPQNNDTETALELAKEARKNPENKKCKKTNNDALNYCDYNRVIELLKGPSKAQGVMTPASDLHLLDAAEKSNLAEIEKALQQGAKINALDEDDETALYKSAKNKNLPAVKFLISKGADTNLKTTQSETALSAAIVSQNYDIIKTLIQYGSIVDLKDLQFKTPLIELIDDVNKDGYRSSNLTRLHQYNLLQMLIAKNSDPEYGVKTKTEKQKGNPVVVKSTTLYTGLIAAADLGNADIVRFLLTTASPTGKALADPNVIITDDSLDVYGRALEVAKYVATDPTAQKNCNPGKAVVGNAHPLSHPENILQPVKSYCDYNTTIELLSQVTKGKPQVSKSMENVEE
jgi:ankyrin repeat protein